MARETTKTSRRPPEAAQPAPAASQARARLDRFFGLTASGSSVATELRAGLATFLTMAYIMFVNPAILEKAGMDHGAVFVATCLAAAAGSAIMGLYANYSIATGIGLGFIAYVALKALSGRFSEINAAVGVIAACFLLKLIFA